MANLNRAAFDNTAVNTATNPSQFGHHHGPIPHANSAWVPPSRATLAPGARPPQVSAAENGAAPNPGSVMSSVNGGICDIDTGGGVMCGTVCGDQPSLRRHLRNAHPGAVANPSRQNTSIAENVAGQNALKYFVLSGGWRQAQYIREPGRGPPGGLIGMYADACEQIAATDASFAAVWGTRFHRDEPPPKTHRAAHAKHVLQLVPSGQLNSRSHSVSSGGLSQCPAPAEHMPCPVDAPQAPTPVMPALQAPPILDTRLVPAATPSSGKRNRGPTPPPPGPNDSGASPSANKRPRSGRKGKATKAPPRAGTRRSARVNVITPDV